MKKLAALYLVSFATLLAAPGPEGAVDLPAINAPATTDSFPGKFIWADLFSADPAAAEKFYTGLFGWTSVTLNRTTASGTRPYIVLSVDDRPVAGIILRPRRMQDEVHGRWVGYVSVPDVAQALAAATAGGGKVLIPAKDLPQRGTQAVLTDPEGAILGLMHSTSGDPGEYRPDPGDWTWAQLFSHDPAAAGLYYHNAFNYEALLDTRTDRSNDVILASGGYSRASIVPVPPRPKAHPVWLLFVRVADVKAAVAQATSLGGRVLVAPSEASTEYWRAVVADPSGAAIGLVELENPAPNQEEKP